MLGIPMYVIDLLIGTLTAIVVGRYIIKGYSAAGVLMLGGFFLLAVSVGLGREIIPGSSTGFAVLDIFEFTKQLLSSRAADLGMMIMILCGFAAYMNYIGANDVVVKLVSKPLQHIKSPLCIDDRGLFYCMLNVFCGVVCCGIGRFIDGYIIPIDG